MLEAREADVDGRRPPIGTVERSLLRQGLRYALGLRLIVVALSSLSSLLLTEAPRQAVTVAIVVGLNGWNLCYARGMLRGSPKRWVPADVAVICAVCLTQPWTVRSDPRGGGTWVLIAMVITVVTYAWQLPWPALAAGTAAILAAHYVGTVLADPGGWLVSEAVEVWTAAEAALSWALYRFVRRGARTADQTVERGEELRRTAAIAAARRDDEREYLAALHDTASVTLLMIGNGVLTRREPWLAEQARRDLGEISRSDAAHHGELDLIELLREVSGHLPLRVSWRTPDSLALPAVDAVSLSRGAREALTNIVRHAGVDHAEISVLRDPTGVTVEIVDEGVGFDPEQVAPHRYGLTRSLTDRMTRRGGEARILSSAPAPRTPADRAISGAAAGRARRAGIPAGALADLRHALRLARRPAPVHRARAGHRRRAAARLRRADARALPERARQPHRHEGESARHAGGPHRPGAGAEDPRRRAAAEVAQKEKDANDLTTQLNATKTNLADLTAQNNVLVPCMRRVEEAFDAAANGDSAGITRALRLARTACDKAERKVDS